MKSILSLVICLLSVSGCAVSPSVQKVNTPLPIRCKVEYPEKPILPFDTEATKQMGIFEKSKLLLAQDELEKGYIVQLESALNTCATETLTDSEPNGK